MLGNRPGRHTRTTGNGPRRGPALLAALTVPAIALAVAGIWLVATPVMKAATPTATAARASRPSGAVLSRSTTSPAAALRSAARPGRLVLSRNSRRSCPRAASACVDLSDHITWLQSGGQVTYGPVRMEPGGRSDPTPRGVFHVAWKAGAHYISTSFGVPIPYAVFFAPGGIAFHAGSLSSSSHGCVHLRLHDARYYHDHLPIGAEVDVFKGVRGS
jgi:lipoprotein-anchoring transpeptidase ErfK/SrfK